MRIRIGKVSRYLDFQLSCTVVRLLWGMYLCTVRSAGGGNLGANLEERDLQLGWADGGGPPCPALQAENHDSWSRRHLIRYIPTGRYVPDIMKIVPIDFAIPIHVALYLDISHLLHARDVLTSLNTLSKPLMMATTRHPHWIR